MNLCLNLLLFLLDRNMSLSSYNDSFFGTNAELNRLFFSKEIVHCCLEKKSIGDKNLEEQLQDRSKYDGNSSLLEVVKDHNEVSLEEFYQRLGLIRKTNALCSTDSIENVPTISNLDSNMTCASNVSQMMYCMNQKLKKNIPHLQQATILNKPKNNAFSYLNLNANMTSIHRPDESFPVNNGVSAFSHSSETSKSNEPRMSGGNSSKCERSTLMKKKRLLSENERVHNLNSKFSKKIPKDSVEAAAVPQIMSARNLLYGTTEEKDGKAEHLNNHLDSKKKSADNSSDRKKDETEMINSMLSEILDTNPNVKFDDIAGLDFIKATIKEIVIWPFLRPDIFCGLRAPPKGLLLFGPPGTGKTLIGKCIATESNATFFCISASSLTSKYVGEGEKLVRTMFDVARSRAPSVIFIDEIDSLLTQRTGKEHDHSRKLKTEFLVQFDGAKTSNDERILVVGATNRPQELDEAARRRFVKRLFVPLPDFNARQQIIVKLISKYRHQLSAEDLDQITNETEGYSCSDVTNFCQEAAMGPIRSSYAHLETIHLDELRPIDLSDFERALKLVKSSVCEADINAHVEFDRKFGCGNSL